MKLERASARPGFTLIEMLIVIAIVLLISSVMIPVALSALGEQEISGAASTVQAAFSLTRDQATREGRPVGLRLVPDPLINDQTTGRIAANRILVLQVPPNHSDGQAEKIKAVAELVPGVSIQRIMAVQNKTETVPGTAPPIYLPGAPTSWYGNIRQGERLAFGDAGNEYIVAGPTYLFRDQEGYDIARNLDPNSTSGVVINPERFTFGDLNGDPTDGIQSRALPSNVFAEYLLLVNGFDDDGDGYTDEGFDGVNNNNDYYPSDYAVVELRLQPIIDPGYNGIDDDRDGYVDEMDELVLYYDTATRSFGYSLTLGEYEPEDFRGSKTNDPQHYSIQRRPLPSADGRDIQLPGNAVIDLSSSNLGFMLSERSKVPYDPMTGYVEFLIYPTGQIVPSNHTGNFTSSVEYPSFYLWIAERDDVQEPLWGVNPAAAAVPPFKYRYAMPRGTPFYLDHNNDGQIDTAFADKSGSYLEGDRRMVVVSPRSGHAAVTPIIGFDASNINAVFGAASSDQSGGRITGQ